MLGLYIHIPFCEQRCPYCDFNTSAGATRQLMDDYVAALCRELEARLTPLVPTGRQVRTVFVGGGTPTMLDASHLDEILKTYYNQVARQKRLPSGELKQTNTNNCRAKKRPPSGDDTQEGCVAPDAEVTIEANPGTLASASHSPEISLAKLEDLQKSGFNRMSFGAQSFDDGVLKTLGRIHSAAEIKEAFYLARQAGFDNINLDLIFAVPGQTMAIWQSTLRQAIALNPEHISTYALTYEEGTPFRAWRDSGRLKPLSEDGEAAMFEVAIAALTGAGYEQYEISNFARPGRRSRHNQIYWRGEEYVGAGAGAHGYLNGERYWNEKLPQRYIERVRQDGGAVVGSERLAPRERLGEALMLGLRLLDGVHLDALTERFRLDPRVVFRREMRRLQALGLLHQQGGRLALTRQGVLVANQVFMAFV